MSSSLKNCKWTLLKSKDENSALLLKRSSHTINQIGNKLFIFGGEEEPRVAIDSNLLSFDLIKQEWSVLDATENSPSQRLAHSSCVLGDKLYIFGGRCGVDMEDTSFNDLYEFDSSSNKWTKYNEENNGVWPEKRSYHTMAALNNKIYIFGGCSTNHGRLNDLFEFDLEIRKWTKLNSCEDIKGRGGSALVAFESSDETKEPSLLYVIAGFCGEELDDCYQYNIVEKKWSKSVSLPRKLSVFAYSSIKRRSNLRLVVHGGEVDPSTLGHKGAGEFCNDTYVFDGQSWIECEFQENSQRPSNRGWHYGCSGENGKFYIFGGNLEDNERTNELWCLEF